MEYTLTLESMTALNSKSDQFKRTSDFVRRGKFGELVSPSMTLRSG